MLLGFGLYNHSVERKRERERENKIRLSTSFGEVPGFVAGVEQYLSFIISRREMVFPDESSSVKIISFNDNSRGCEDSGGCVRVFCL